MMRTRKVKAKVKVGKGKIKEKTGKAKIKALRRHPDKKLVDVPEGAHRRAHLEVIPAIIPLRAVIQTTLPSLFSRQMSAGRQL